MFYVLKRNLESINQAELPDFSCPLFLCISKAVFSRGGENHAIYVELEFVSVVKNYLFIASIWFQLVRNQDFTWWGGKNLLIFS